jgi:hypothetical protein
MDSKCEALAFPHLFPTGKGTLLGDDEDIKRTIPFTAKKIFHPASIVLCLLNVLLVFCIECM